MIDSIKAFAADNMVGFSVSDIPLFLFQVFFAGLLAYVMTRFYPGAKESRPIASYLTLALVLAGITGMVKHSVALSIIAVGVLLVLRLRNLSQKFDNPVLLLVVMFSGIAAGAGLAIPAALVCILVLIVAWGAQGMGKSS